MPVKTVCGVIPPAVRLNYSVALPPLRIRQLAAAASEPISTVVSAPGAPGYVQIAMSATDDFPLTYCIDTVVSAADNATTPCVEPFDNGQGQVAMRAVFHQVTDNVTAAVHGLPQGRSGAVFVHGSLRGTQRDAFFYGPSPPAVAGSALGPPIDEADGASDGEEPNRPSLTTLHASTGRANDTSWPGLIATFLRAALKLDKASCCTVEGVEIGNEDGNRTCLQRPRTVRTGEECVNVSRAIKSAVDDLSANGRGTSVVAISIGDASSDPRLTESRPAPAGYRRGPALFLVSLPLINYRTITPGVRSTTDFVSVTAIAAALRIARGDAGAARKRLAKDLGLPSQSIWERSGIAGTLRGGGSVFVVGLVSPVAHFSRSSLATLRLLDSISRLPCSMRLKQLPPSVIWCTAKPLTSFALPSPRPVDQALPSVQSKWRKPPPVKAAIVPHPPTIPAPRLPPRKQPMFIVAETARSTDVKSAHQPAPPAAPRRALPADTSRSKLNALSAREAEGRRTVVAICSTELQVLVTRFNHIIQGENQRRKEHDAQRAPPAGRHAALLAADQHQRVAAAVPLSAEQPTDDSSTTETTDALNNGAPARASSVASSKSTPVKRRSPTPVKSPLSRRSTSAVSRGYSSRSSTPTPRRRRSSSGSSRGSRDSRSSSRHSPPRDGVPRRAAAVHGESNALPPLGADSGAWVPDAPCVASPPPHRLPSVDVKAPTGSLFATAATTVVATKELLDVFGSLEEPLRRLVVMTNEIIDDEPFDSDEVAQHGGLVAAMSRGATASIQRLAADGDVNRLDIDQLQAARWLVSQLKQAVTAGTHVADDAASSNDDLAEMWKELLNCKRDLGKLVVTCCELCGGELSTALLVESSSLLAASVSSFGFPDVFRALVTRCALGDSDDLNASVWEECAAAITALHQIPPAMTVEWHHVVIGLSAGRSMSSKWSQVLKRAEPQVSWEAKLGVQAAAAVGSELVAALYPPL